MDANEYLKTDDACRKAWFEYKDLIARHNPTKVIQLVTFVAGWNAAIKYKDANS